MAELGETKYMQVIGISESDHAKTVLRLIQIDDAVAWAARPALPLPTKAVAPQPTWEPTPVYVFGVNIRKLSSFIA
jgi:hypothetical protein